MEEALVGSEEGSETEEELDEELDETAEELDEELDDEDTAPERKVPTWSKLVIGLLVLAIGAGALGLVLQNAEQPQAVKDLAELTDGLGLLNEQVGTLNGLLSQALAASAQLSPNLQAKLGKLPERLAGVQGAAVAVKPDASAQLDSERAELTTNLESLQRQAETAELQARLGEGRGKTQARLEELGVQLESVRFELASRVEELQAEIAEIREEIQEIIDRRPGPGP